MGNKVLIVEDDHVIARLMRIYLDEEGYQTEVVFDGLEAIEAIKTFQPQLVVLDLMLPGLDGVEICRQARTFYKGMILVVTASVDELSEVSLLKYGADDYVTKPIKSRILLARVEALFRRLPEAVNTSDVRLRLTVDNKSKSVSFDGEAVNLTASEFDIFYMLYQSFGEVLSRESCCKAIRGIEYNSCDRTVDMRVSGLRKRLVKEGVNIVSIKTVRNQGYALVET